MSVRPNNIQFLSTINRPIIQSIKAIYPIVANKINLSHPSCTLANNPLSLPFFPFYSDVEEK